MAFHKLTLLPLVLLLATAIFADESTSSLEIQYLIDAIGDSNCVFIRNGKRHSAKEARRHIRSKYSRAKRYASTAELFIERLASKSSVSKKPYWMECPGDEPMRSGDWLEAELERYRAGQRQPEP